MCFLFGKKQPFVLRRNASMEQMSVVLLCGADDLTTCGFVTLN